MSASGGFARFLRFAAVGAVGTLAHYALLVALVEGAGAPPLAGASAGFVLGALVNYALARRLVFASNRSHGPSTHRTPAGNPPERHPLCLSFRAEQTGTGWL